MERRRILSGSVGGRPIKVVATTTPGTLIHEPSVASGYESLMHLFAVNTSASPVVLTIEFGGVSSPDDQVITTIPAKSGWVEIVPGFPLDKGRAIRAFAASGNVVLVGGYASLVDA